MKHLIISRVNLHMELDTWKYPVEKPYEQPGWNDDRIRLLNEYARNSLRNQDSDNFIFITLWQKGHVEEGGELDNELKIEIEQTGEYDDKPLDYQALLENKLGKYTLNYAEQIRFKVCSEILEFDLITNLDCDDCLRHDFVSTMHAKVEEKRENGTLDNYMHYYFDVIQRYCYDEKTGKTGVKKRRTPSPFITTYERGYKLLAPLRYNHTDIEGRIPGCKVPGLYALQTINSTNMYSKSVGNPCEVNLLDYGIETEQKS